MMPIELNNTVIIILSIPLITGYQKIKTARLAELHRTETIEKRVFKDCGSYWTLRELGRARTRWWYGFKVVLMSCLRKDAKVGSAIVRDLACRPFDRSKAAANSSLSCCGMTG